MQVLVGCGGWGYFRVPGSDSLSSYAKAYDFVETNSTFYQVPSDGVVKGWRHKVPDDFVFTVKCHRELTHDIGLRPVERAFGVLDRMKRICAILDAPLLVLQTPPGFLTPVGEVRDFFAGIGKNGPGLTWDIRGKNRGDYLGLAEETGVAISVDLTQEGAPKGDVLYSRIFGPDPKEPLGNAAHAKISEKVSGCGAKKVYLTFHGSKMYKDAAGFILYQREKK
jgi:uncharacterized protein YecE (DUF72 family)